MICLQSRPYDFEPKFGFFYEAKEGSDGEGIAVYGGFALFGKFAKTLGF